MTRSGRLLCIPLTYLYRTRIESARGLVGYVAREYIPIAVALKAAAGTSLWMSAMAFAGFLALYECGYLDNDRQETAREPGGDRAAGLAVAALPFVLARAALFAGIAVLFWHRASAQAALGYALVGLLVPLLLLLHSSTVVRRTRFARVGTFAALAFYKPSCMVVPALGWTDAMGALSAAFLCYGMPRVIVYVLRKYGDPGARAAAEASSTRLQWGFLLIAAPVLLGAWPRTPALIWSLHLLALAAMAGLHAARDARARLRSVQPAA